MDYKTLLIKYVAQVAATEGPDFATSTNMPPCGMLSMEFTDEEKIVLEQEVYPRVWEWDSNPT